MQPPPPPQEVLAGEQEEEDEAQNRAIAASLSEADEAAGFRLFESVIPRPTLPLEEETAIESVTAEEEEEVPVRTGIFEETTGLPSAVGAYEAPPRAAAKLLAEAPSEPVSTPEGEQRQPEREKELPPQRRAPVTVPRDVCSVGVNTQRPLPPLPTIETPPPAPAELHPVPIEAAEDGVYYGPYYYQTVGDVAVEVGGRESYRREYMVPWEPARDQYHPEFAQYYYTYGDAHPGRRVRVIQRKECLGGLCRWDEAYTGHIVGHEYWGVPQQQLFVPPVPWRPVLYFYQSHE